MKFKKFLAITCSFLLATTSLLCGGPASAKNWRGQNVCVFMVNSGEELGDGKRDGDKCDKACLGTITKDANFPLVKVFGNLVDVYKNTLCKYLMLSPEYPTAVEAMEYMTIVSVPDVFVVVANLAKDSTEVANDINKHLKQILDCQKKSVLYNGSEFKSSKPLCGKEVYLDTVPVIIFGVVPKGEEQKTSNDVFVKIAERIRLERQGNGAGDDKFKYIHNEVFILKSNGTRICINMVDNIETIGFDIYQAIETIAETDSLKPTLWPSYHGYERLLRQAGGDPQLAKQLAEEEARRKAEEEAEEEAEEKAKRKAAEEAKRKAEEEARRKAQAKRKNKNILGGTLVGLGGALAIGSAIFGGVKYNQKKKIKGNKTKVAKAQKMQVSAIS